MSSQIFKNAYPKENLFIFLDRYAEKKVKYYYFTKTSFKKAVFEKAIVPYCNGLTEYYYSSKHKYLEKMQTYRSFITIIRQICKYHHISFTSKIKYDKSNYEIVYYIYFE